MLVEAGTAGRVCGNMGMDPGAVGKMTAFGAVPGAGATENGKGTEIVVPGGGGMPLGTA